MKLELRARSIGAKRIAPYGGRGLKPTHAQRPGRPSGIAPYGGRGLKQIDVEQWMARYGIAPYGGRGLKPPKLYSAVTFCVSPPTGGAD